MLEEENSARILDVTAIACLFVPTQKNWDYYRQITTYKLTKIATTQESVDEQKVQLHGWYM